MDTDEGIRTTREIAKSIQLAQGRARVGSMEHLQRGLVSPPAVDRGSRGT